MVSVNIIVEEHLRNIRDGSKGLFTALRVFVAWGKLNVHVGLDRFCCINDGISSKVGAEELNRPPASSLEGDDVPVLKTVHCNADPWLSSRLSATCQQKATSRMK